MGFEAIIKEAGLKIGFDKVAIARAQNYPEHEALKGWLHQSFHGEMGWMERGLAKRLDPKEIFPQAQSIITCALNYNTDHPYSTECADSERGWIARYAWGEDYHLVMEKMLKDLGEAICHEVPGTVWRSYVDTGPVMERVFAKNSGLGWIGKNTCIIDRKLGSFLFLGVILTDLELKPDEIVPDYCGSCTACIDACPTQAITKPYEIDSRKCISYLTIEHRGEITPKLKEKMGDHIFGCDICQDVCPWNRKSPKTERKEFEPREGFFNPPLKEFQKKVEKDYPKDFKNSPLKRAKKEGLSKNIENALSNQQFSNAT